LAIYKCDRGFELGATEKQIQIVVRAGLIPGTAGLRVHHPYHVAMLPPDYFVVYRKKFVYGLKRMIVFLGGISFTLSARNVYI